MSERVDVAVAVILKNGAVLISRRDQQVHQGGRWEFPGGKIEHGESTEQALSRELEEELGVSVIEQSKFMEIQYDYPDKQVRLDVRLVTAYNGTEQGLEGQPILWVMCADLVQYPFPDANKAIVEKVSQLT